MDTELKKTQGSLNILWSWKAHLLATLPLCTMEGIVTWWTYCTTVITITGEFDIRAMVVIIFPTSSTIAGAPQPQHQCHVSEARCNHQGDLYIQFHCVANSWERVRSGLHAYGFLVWLCGLCWGRVFEALNYWGVVGLHSFGEGKMLHRLLICYSTG